MKKPLWRIVAYARPYRVLVLWSVLLNLLSTVFALASIGMIIPVLRIIFNRDITAQPAPQWEGDLLAYAEEYLMYQLSGRVEQAGQEQALLYVVMLVVLAFFLKNTFRYLSLFVIAPFRSGITRDLRLALHQKVLALPLSYFTEQRKGDVISRMTSDLKEIENSMLSTVEMLFKEPFIVLLSLGILVYMSPQLTLFVLVLLPLVTIVITRVGKSLKRSAQKAQKQVGHILSLAEEDLSGLKVIKAFTAEAQKRAAFTRATNQYFRLMNKVLRKSDLASPISEFLGATVMALIIWYGGMLVLKDESFTAEQFIAYVLFFYQIIPPSKNLSKASYKIQQGNASAERVLEILDAENPIQDPPQPLAMLGFSREINFEKVFFSYENEMVLRDINLRVEKGKTYALVGESGGGKTTLTNLVPRFYDVDRGSIRIDGVDLRDLKLSDLRSLLGIVTQETLLFNESVAYNIALGRPEASREEIIAAAKIANAHRFIEKLEQGYDTGIGDGGSKLSGGQKQRLSIARAVLKNPPILILDEATSALDTESEKLVQEALFKLMKNRTSLVIAHRLSTIQHADEILVIQNGEIAERGNHTDLLAQEGIYHKLVEMQSFS